MLLDVVVSCRGVLPHARPVVLKAPLRRRHLIWRLDWCYHRSLQRQTFLLQRLTHNLLGELIDNVIRLWRLLLLWRHRHFIDDNRRHYLRFFHLDLVRWLQLVFFLHLSWRSPRCLDVVFLDLDHLELVLQLLHLEIEVLFALFRCASGCRWLPANCHAVHFHCCFAR